MQVGKLNPQNGAKINFPGFQEILDFTSAGSESSVSVAVDGDVDKEYKIVARNLTPNRYIITRLNSDTGNNYGRQYIYNNNGSISSGRSVHDAFYCFWYGSGGSLGTASLLTPSGMVKTFSSENGTYTSGTTVYDYIAFGASYNSTSNITELKFLLDNVGTFTAGTRITVYARRSNV